MINWNILPITKKCEGCDNLTISWTVGDEICECGCEAGCLLGEPGPCIGYKSSKLIGPWNDRHDRI